jgi:hypothetical protein
MATKTKKTAKSKRVVKRAAKTGRARTNSRRKSGHEQGAKRRSPAESSAHGNVRSLTKTGGGRSYTVSLPREAIRAFGWQERQKLVLLIDPRRRTILIKDWKK